MDTQAMLHIGTCIADQANGNACPSLQKPIRMLEQSAGADPRFPKEHVLWPPQFLSSDSEPRPLHDKRLESNILVFYYLAARCKIVQSN